jgi:predicted membrane chloride channel (bestrophin family)
MPTKLWAILYRVLQLLALALLVAAFAQALPFDLMALVVAGDMLTYMEIAAAVWLAAQVTRIKWAAAYARFVLARTVRRVLIRARRAVRRIAHLRPPSNDDDRPAPGFAYA